MRKYNRLELRYTQRQEEIMKGWLRSEFGLTEMLRKMKKTSQHNNVYSLIARYVREQIKYETIIF